MEIPKREKPFSDAREDMSHIILTGANSLTERTRHFPPNGEFTLEMIRGILERITTTRLTAKQKHGRDARYHFRALRTPRARDSIGRVALQRLAWHSGSGSWNLHGSMYARFEIGCDTFETLDSFAVLYLEIFTRNGTRYSNDGRWSAILNGTARDAGAGFYERYRKGDS